MKTISKIALAFCTIVVLTTCKIQNQPEKKPIKSNYPTQYKLQENPKA